MKKSEKNCKQAEAELGQAQVVAIVRFKLNCRLILDGEVLLNSCLDGQILLDSCIKVEA